MGDTEKGRDRGGGRLLTGSPMWDLIPGPGSHPGPKTDAQPLSHQASLKHKTLKNKVLFLENLHTVVEM